MSSPFCKLCCSKNVNCNDMFAETFRIKLNIYNVAFFAKIVNGFKPLTVFLQKCSLIDVWMDYKHASDSLDAPWERALLISFILQYLCHNQFAFCFWKWKHYIEIFGPPPPPPLIREGGWGRDRTFLTVCVGGSKAAFRFSSKSLL